MAISLSAFNDHCMATEIANNYESWNSDRQVWLERVREVIQYVYATSTRETSNKENGWSHSTHIPKLTQIHDNLISNYSSALFGNEDFFTFEAGKIEDTYKAKRTAVTNYLKTKHRYNGLKEAMDACLADWVQTGNCFARVEYVREMDVDSQTGEHVVLYEGPKVYRISPYDIVFNPFASNFRASPKIIRSVVTRADIIRRVEETEGVDYDEEEIERMMQFRSTTGLMKDHEINKQIQRQYDGFGTAAAYFKSGCIELLEFVGDIYDDSTGELLKNYIITVADRKFIIRKQKMDDYTNIGRIFHAGWRNRPDNLYAQGPLDNLVGMQYLINHLENARADAFDQMLSPDRVHVGNVQIEHDGPVTNYYIDDGQGSVQNLAPDATALQADFQIQVKEAQMEAYAGAPREAMGMRSPGEKTAFEVQQLQNAAMRLFQTRIEQFEMKFVEPILNHEIEMAVKNLQTSDVIKVLDVDEGVEDFLSITVDDIRSKGKLKARGALHFGKRAVLVQELQQFGQILMGDQAMAVHFPAKARAKAWADAMQLDKYDLYRPFGQIDEQTELEQAMRDAQGASVEDQAASEVQQDIMMEMGDEEEMPLEM